MQRDIALLTLTASLGLMGLRSDSVPIGPLSTLETGVNLVHQIHPKESPKPWYNCTTQEAWEPGKGSWCQKVNRLKNTQYRIPQVGLVQLKNGTYTNLARNLRVFLVEQPGTIVFSDSNKDGKEEATVLIGVKSGDSETLIHLSVPVSQTELSSRLVVNLQINHIVS
ncbi:MAG: hypothetical protein WCA35_23135 [Kovacikia sp.]